MPTPLPRVRKHERIHHHLIFFYHPDHLGSTSYVTDADGNIAQHVEYIPYGEVFVEERNNSFSTNYLFNAKELDNETGLYYYGARYLDPMGAMWLSVDPMWEKYAGMSPYNYCAGNPVKLVDPDGRDVYVFSEDGRYSHKEEHDGVSFGRYMGKQKPIDFKFADPVNDPKALEGYIDENGVKYKIDRIKFMSSESIDNALWNSGVYNKENQEERWNFAISESDASAGSGKMDYVCTANFERGRYQKVLNEIGDVSEIASNELYITNTKSGYYAHNDHNFGNFLWGAGMNALGFREYTARLGAHIFALKKEGELDSSDDQLSIKLGFEWRK